MGDVLMLIPIVNHLRQLNPKEKYVLATEPENIPFMKTFNVFHDVININGYNPRLFTKIIDTAPALLPYTVPGHPDQHLNLVELYVKFFGLKITKYDWSVKMDIEKKVEFIRNGSAD